MYLSVEGKQRKRKRISHKWTSSYIQTRDNYITAAVRAMYFQLVSSHSPRLLSERWRKCLYMFSTTFYLNIAEHEHNNWDKRALLVSGLFPLDIEIVVIRRISYWNIFINIVFRLLPYQIIYLVCIPLCFIKIHLRWVYWSRLRWRLTLTQRQSLRKRQRRSQQLD